MRLSSEKINFLKHTILQYCPDAEVYLFGSRADDSKTGGDIDLLILTHTASPLKARLKILAAFFKKFGEQKLDLVFTGNKSDPFAQIAIKTGCLL